MLTLRDLRKSYSGRPAVDGLTLEVCDGEVFGLLGPNGAGKTTTIHMSVGLLSPDSGSVLVGSGANSGPPTVPGVRRGIGVAPQSLALYDELTAEENLRFFGRLYGLGGQSLRSRTDEMLVLVGLEERRRGRVATYSGGMKRRLNLAVALMHDPPLLLLDEPTVGVDPQSRSAIFDLVRRLRAEGRTVVYTTHYMEEAERLCDRVGILDQGRLLALGTVEALLRSHGGKSIVVVERDGVESRTETADPVGALSAMLKEPGVSAAHVSRPNLETVFLSLTGRRLRD